MKNKSIFLIVTLLITPIYLSPTEVSAQSGWAEVDCNKVSVSRRNYCRQKKIEIYGATSKSFGKREREIERTMRRVDCARIATSVGWGGYAKAVGVSKRYIASVVGAAISIPSNKRFPDRATCLGYVKNQIKKHARKY